MAAAAAATAAATDSFHSLPSSPTLLSLPSIARHSSSSLLFSLPPCPDYSVLRPSLFLPANFSSDLRRLGLSHPRLVFHPAPRVKHRRKRTRSSTNAARSCQDQLTLMSSRISPITGPITDARQRGWPAAPGRARRRRGDDRPSVQVASE